MGKEKKVSSSKKEESKPVRPALIVSEWMLSEYSIFVKRLLVGLAAESIAVAFICPRDIESESFALPSVEIIRHPEFERGLLWRRSRKILIERLEQFKPSVLHCLCESKSFFVRWLSRRLGLPYVLGVNSLQKGFWRLSISSARCAKILVPAKSIASNIIKFYPRFADRIEQINVGSFVSETSGCFSETGQLASMVTLCPSNERGGFENLLSAVKRLAIEGYEFMLVLIGGGRADKQVRKLISAFGLSNIVIMIPRLEPSVSVLSAGDIFIQPEPSNSFNPILLEAMSAGTAVAACRGGVDDLIIEDETAVVFDSEDELSIYKGLQGLLARQDAARRLGRSAQEYLRKNHTVSGMIAAIVHSYRDAQQWLQSSEQPLA
ncbi:MAG: glycosyltransferase family 4 protein [Planctomycetota bacterium]|jgi:glycosyltransferase involved in cell wall biosynthesis